tara:strand:+ start:162482 stop:163207 length:726 start_codon:yes stop_codon:yes gene_type:complete
MSFKDLFIKSDENTKESSSGGAKKFKNQFPTSSTKKVDTESTFNNIFGNGNNKATFKPTENLTSNSTECEPHMDKIMTMYENGFNQLNQDGYDFYEFFKGIVEANGVDNPAIYGMAFTMATTMDKSVSKSSLINQSQFYINEIEKVHNSYVTSGKEKRSNTLLQKEAEETTLASDLVKINEEISRLTTQKRQVENSLSTIDSKYTSQITDIDCKLMANNVAKDTLVNSISSVVDGINKNIK